MRMDVRDTVALRLAIAAMLVVAASPALAQGDSLLQGFKLSPDYMLTIDGAVDETAEVYVSQRIPAFLALSEKLSTPFLLIPRTQQVQTVHIMKVAKKDEETVDLLPGAVMGVEGSFSIVGQELHFSVGGHDVVLAEKPPLLGVKNAADLLTYSADYAHRAEAYTPATGAIAALKAETGDIRVRVFFGSWCPFCRQYVPRMVKVVEEIAGSAVKVDFYGLPHQMSTDPVSGQNGINSVPTGIVWVDGKEAGRIQGDQWRSPEESLVQILGR